MASNGDTVHVVKQGDTLLSIAKQYKAWPWEDVWNHPNNQKLRDKRNDPQVLSEGDQVYVPYIEGGPWSVETTRRHTFVLKAQPAWFRTEVRDDLGQPLINQRFELKVGSKTLKGATNDKGVVELPLDPDPSTVGKLTVFVDSDPPREFTWNFKLGDLNPIDKVSGIKARLINLGFPCGELDESMNDETKKALRDFQVVYRLKVTGQADEETKKKLMDAHDLR
jgi:hypothetical protein